MSLTSNIQGNFSSDELELITTERLTQALESAIKQYSIDRTIESVAICDVESQFLTLPDNWVEGFSNIVAMEKVVNG